MVGELQSARPACYSSSGLLSLSLLTLLLCSSIITAEVIKEGKCPRATPKPEDCPPVGREEEGGKNLARCESDESCAGASKCCVTECQWKECRDPVKKGACPELIERRCLKRQSNVTVAGGCASDLGCDGRLKCCPTECSGVQCREPDMEKEGTCPPVNLDDNVREGGIDCRRGCQEDFDCDGAKKCCFNGCTTVCL